MITPTGSYWVFLATEPVDFRTGMDGLVAQIANAHEMDPFNGSIYVFRSKAKDCLKLIVWDGTGLELVSKRMERKAFFWPKHQHGEPVALSKVRFDALFEGTNWEAVVPARTHKPSFI